MSVGPQSTLHSDLGGIVTSQMYHTESLSLGRTQDGRKIFLMRKHLLKIKTSQCLLNGMWQIIKCQRQVFKRGKPMIVVMVRETSPMRGFLGSFNGRGSS